ncbi:sugar MFS transporter [Microbulbifer sp. YPW1]|uniref:sugar MFS transporter n=1 Tax=Microbulbifer sp. YPW1 TaxID=2745199 RepID=UPI00159A5EA2|nr:sugar MFS transporter [Microbulbifer sp. YPW1]QKX17624.1 sugar MFS transporter [Microbulbifer sp. YPW1]
MAISTSQDAAMVSSDSSTNYLVPLAFLTILFFMWGFITALNDVLIPHLQNVFNLTNLQALLVQFAFFIAYFIVSFVYFVYALKAGDLLVRFGYQNGLSVGLAIMSVGCALFWPAAVLKSYGFFLVALFVLAGGMAVLQIAANPYVSILGKPEGAPARLNLSQALNSLGTTLAPVIGAALIFSHVSADADVNTVVPPYLFMAATLLAMAVFFKVVKLPNLHTEVAPTENRYGVFQHTHLLLGALSIFMYVGAEVALGSVLIKYLGLPEIAGLNEMQASVYLALYWAGLMVGRFLGAAAFSAWAERRSIYAYFAAVTVIAFACVGLLVSWQAAQIWCLLIVVNIALMVVCRFKPNRTLAGFAVACVALLLIALYQKGYWALWCVVAVGLFNSIMWSNIFTLAIRDLGSYTSQGSSLLIMAILGAALVPPLMGWVADAYDLNISLLVPAVCYLYIVFYGVKGYRAERNSWFTKRDT